MAPVTLTGFVSAHLAVHANAQRAREMAAYMKTTMPFYGVPKPLQVPIHREVKRRFAPATHTAYVRNVRALWRLPHREEKYAAITYAQNFPVFITPASVPLYRQLVVEGAWWDLVDDVAARLVGMAYLHHRREMEPILDRWIGNANLWLRRTVILSQLKHKEETDTRRLFRWCLHCAGEQDFFIRKAIGWALRQHARTDPKVIRSFLERHRGRLSPLSVREAGKHLDIHP